MSGHSISNKQPVPTEKYCQSCGMPFRFGSEEQLGTNADMSLSNEYCYLCLREGIWIDHFTMEQMIDIWIEHTSMYNEISGTDYSPDALREVLTKRLPLLKRWHGEGQVIRFHRQAVWNVRYILSIPVDPTATSISVEIDDIWVDSNYEFDVPAVGSYYYEGGLFSKQYISGQTCPGIVFHVDDTQKHGLIVGLEQINAQWSTVQDVTGTSKDYTGPQNLARIKDRGQWQTRYPAFKWCVDQGPEWYIPTISELQLLGYNYPAVNIALEAAGADMIDLTARLWSSAESGPENSYYVFNVDQNWTYGNISKAEYNNVHIVRAF